MKGMAEGIVGVWHKINEIVLDIARLNNSEERELHELRICANVSRINIMVIAILILQCTNLYILFKTDAHSGFQKQYKIATIVMIAACIIQIIYFHIIEWRYPNSIKKKKKYTTVWLFQFTVITWCFHALEFLEDEHYENVFLLLAALNIILVLKNKEILICTGIIIVLEYGFLICIGGKAENYQLIFTLAICAGIIGRVFFVYYMNSNLLQWKLKKTNEELEEQINRYKILQKLTREDIFEYRHKEDKMIISYASGKTSKVYYNYIEKVKKHYIRSFCENDEQKIIEFYNELREQKNFEGKDEMASFTFCVNEKDGVEKEYEVLYTTIFDESKQPVLTIGKLYKLK